MLAPITPLLVAETHDYDYTPVAIRDEYPLHRIWGEMALPELCAGEGEAEGEVIYDNNDNDEKNGKDDRHEYFVGAGGGAEQESEIPAEQKRAGTQVMVVAVEQLHL